MEDVRDLKTHSLPPGLRCLYEVIEPDQEKSLLELRHELALVPYVMRGQASRRLIAAFGGGYDGRFSGPPLPDALCALRARVGRAAGLDGEHFEQVIYTFYPDRAGIGWHIDLPQFGPIILGLSLGGEGRLRFRPRGQRNPVLTAHLPARSLYVMGGRARSEYEHSLMLVRKERVSITFRTFLDPR